MIRSAQYRGKAGFTVTGKDNMGLQFRIFARTESGARLIEAAAKRGDSETVTRLLLQGR